MELKLSVITEDNNDVLKDLKVNEDNLVNVVNMLREGFGGGSLIIEGPERFISIDLSLKVQLIIEKFINNKHLL